MSLPHAILGLLTLEPMTGYDLKNRAFDATIAHFWQADQAQIYRTLGSMAEAGWVASRLEIQEDHPNRKVYHVTDAGRAELLRWLHDEQPLPVHRESFLVQLFFGDYLDKAAVLKHIDKQRAAHRAKLARYQQIPLPALGQGDRRQTFWRLTLEMGLAMEQMYLDWLAQCESVIEALPDQPETA